MLDIATTAVDDASGLGVVACALYRDGQHVRDIPVAEIGALAGREGDIVWLGLHEPDDDRRHLRHELQETCRSWNGRSAIPLVCR